MTYPKPTDMTFPKATLMVTAYQYKKRINSHSLINEGTT